MAEREKVIKGLEMHASGICNVLTENGKEYCAYWASNDNCMVELLKDALSLLKAQEPNKSKYEYHTDHTDCPWYISGEESKCPVTCSQYRDGWNDAMNYIFRNGDGYRPYDKIRKGR